MAYKSEAQRKRLKEMAEQGKIPQSVIDEFDRATVGKKLPDRVPQKARRGQTKIQHVKTVKVLK
jgi:hypothetical protein